MSILTLGFHKVQKVQTKIKAKFAKNSFFWQINVTINIILYKINIFVIAEINNKKNLNYQLIPKKSQNITLTIFLIIFFINNQ